MWTKHVKRLFGCVRKLCVTNSDASVHGSCSDDFDYCCKSCSTRGGHVEAVAYCVECTDYLCISCIKNHLQNSKLMRHVLLNLQSRITNIAGINEDDKNGSQHHTMDDNSADYIEHTNNLTFLKSVNVEAESDTDYCHVTAILVLSGQLLAVADYNNDSVKIIDVDDDTVKNTIKLTNHPMSMTLLPEDQLAVTLAYAQRFNIISTRGGINVISTIRVDRYCNDIVYFDGKLLISFENPLMFQILNMKGKVLNKIVPRQNVKSSCSLPRHIALSPDQKNIFISDYENKISLSVNMKGKKVAECRELTKPSGIVCSPNLPYIIVCDRTEHQVRKMTMDLQCGEILLNKGDGLSFPKVLCFYPEQRWLIVSSVSVQAEHCNNIRIYQFE